MGWYISIKYRWMSVDENLVTYYGEPTETMVFTTHHPAKYLFYEMMHERDIYRRARKMEAYGRRPKAMNIMAIYSIVEAPPGTLTDEDVEKLTSL